MGLHTHKSDKHSGIFGSTLGSDAQCERSEACAVLWELKMPWETWLGEIGYLLNEWPRKVLRSPANSSLYLARLTLSRSNSATR